MIVRGDRVVFPDGVRPATIHIADGRIAAIGPTAESSGGDDVIDARGFVVLPGLVDSHVHLNEPGRTEWEGFMTGTRAAAAGGVTTLVDMPLNSVPATTTVAGLAAKRVAAQAKCHVDVAFWGGVVPGNAAEIEPLARAGVCGFKCFLSPSGVDEFPSVDEDALRAALPAIARSGLPLLVHAEWPAALRTADGSPRRYKTWLDSRPPQAEVAAVELMVRLSREYGARIHIVHLATTDALPVLRAARTDGVAVTVETCPHYLSFAAEEIADGATAFKCAPPIRAAAEREALWRALDRGDVDLIATDHSPAPPALKHVDDGDFVAAWGGIASLQLGLAIVWTGALTRDIDFTRLARWMAAAPAGLAGLSPRKGAIAVGADADFVIWDPDASQRIDQSTLYHRHPLTPYHGRSLRGKVQTTILRGHVIYDEGTCTGHPVGQLL